MTDLPCDFAKPYREYAKTTEGGMPLMPFADKISLAMPICCTENAPFVMFRGKPDNFRCDSARKRGSARWGGHNQLPQYLFLHPYLPEHRFPYRQRNDLGSSQQPLRDSETCL